MAFGAALERWGAYGPMAVAGDSAGGSLAATLSRRRREAGLPGPACQVLIYPVLDLGPGPEALAYPSYRECAKGYGLTDAHMRWYRSLYLAGREELDVPDVSPLRDRRFDGLPPTLVLTAEYDVLRDEAELYAARLREGTCRLSCIGSTVTCTGSSVSRSSPTAPARWTWCAPRSPGSEADLPP